MKKQKKTTRTILLLLLLVVVIIVLPLIVKRGAEFGGSDNAASAMVSEITNSDYQPWFTPVFERIIGSEIPGEVETLLFCVQTGIGTGILGFGFGYLVARKKYTQSTEEQ